VLYVGPSTYIAVDADHRLGNGSNHVVKKAGLIDEAWYSGSVVCIVHRASEAGFCGRRLQSIRNLISPGFRAFRASVTQVS
jgi:hypothetical protein